MFNRQSWSHCLIIKSPGTFNRRPTMKQVFSIISLFLPILYLSGLRCADAYTQTQFYNLSTNLFQTYNPGMRPTSNGEATNVYVSVYLASLEELSMRSQVLEASIVLESSWEDANLWWNESEHGGITHFLYQQDKVWLPDLVVEKSVKRREQMGCDEKNKVDILSSGNVRWMPGESINSACDIDVKYFPFDTQTCTIVISTWMSARDEVNLFPGSDTTGGMLLTKYSPSGTWDVMENTFQELEDHDNNNNPTRVQFTLKLKRLRTFYVLLIVLPLVLLSIISTMGFLLPIGNKEKVVLSITALVAYTMYLSRISHDIPETSRQTSLLAVYLNFLLAFKALTVILTVLVLHTQGRTGKVGQRKAALTRAVRRLLCISCLGESNQNNGDVETGKKQNHFSFVPRYAVNKTYREEDEEQTWRGVEETTRQSHQNRKDVTSVGHSRIRNSSQEGPEVAPSEVRVHLSTAPYDTQLAGLDNREITWDMVAATLDRLCFFILFFLFIFFSIIFLTVMATGDA